MSQSKMAKLATGQCDPRIRIILETELINFHPTDERPIGFGSRGNVYKRQYNGKYVAVKYSNDPNCEGFLKEADHLIKMNHRNIIRLIGCCKNPLALVLELAPNGSLHSVTVDMNFNHELPYSTLSKRWAGQCADALEAMHDKKLIHRDVKPQNMLLFDNYTLLKVGDFDCSRDYSTRMTSNRGTIPFIAPELIAFDDQCEYTWKIDVYSFGVMLWQIEARRAPHENLNQFHIVWSMKNSFLRPEPIESPWYTLMTQCWHEDHDLRPEMSKVKELLQRE